MGQRNSKGLFGETDGRVKKGRRNKRKVGKLFCALPLVSLMLECTGQKVRMQRLISKCNLNS